MQENHCKGSCPPPRKRDKDDKWIELVLLMFGATIVSLLCGGAYIFFLVSDTSWEHPATESDLSEELGIWGATAALIYVCAFLFWCIRSVDIWWRSRQEHRTH
jgi:hypothetical protein